MSKRKIKRAPETEVLAEVTFEPCARGFSEARVFIDDVCPRHTFDEIFSCSLYEITTPYKTKIYTIMFNDVVICSLDNKFLCNYLFDMFVNILR